MGSFNDAQLPKLFQPYSLSCGINLPHRIVLAPLTRFRADKDTQVPKPFVQVYYEQRATCKGLLITEATGIHKDAARYPGVPGIYTEEHVNAWKAVTNRVHAKGAKIFMQLWHVGRSIHSSLLDGRLPVSSSAVSIRGVVRGRYTEACGGLKEAEVPRALEVHEIKEIINQYVKAAENAIKAGFDGVELHGANGYLIDQFLRDGVNQRTDEYGGSWENRCRFLLEIIKEISTKIGEERLSVRLSPFNAFNDMSDSDPLGLFMYLLRKLSQTYSNLGYIHLTSYPGRVNNLDEDTQKKLELQMFQLRKAWTGTFILNLWRIERDKAIQLVEEGKTDLIAVGKDFLANPDLPERLMKNVPLNPQRPETFYTHEEEGYTDYSFYHEITNGLDKE